VPLLGHFPAKSARPDQFIEVQIGMSIETNEFNKNIKEIIDNNCKLCFIFNQVQVKRLSNKRIPFFLIDFRREWNEKRTVSEDLYLCSICFFLIDDEWIPGAIARAKEIAPPIGEMVPRGR